MSQNKKRKQCTQNRKPLKSYLTITKTYFDDFVNTAHKYMLLAGLETAMFDALTKRTKLVMMKVKFMPYRIYAETGHKVPHQHVKFCNQFMRFYEKQNYYGDPKFNITFLDSVVYGLPFVLFLDSFEEYDDIAADQKLLLQKIKTPVLRYFESHPQCHYAVVTSMMMKCFFMHISSPQYRYYSATRQEVGNNAKGRIDNIITISSIAFNLKNFFMNREMRSAYPLGFYNIMVNDLEMSPTMASIPLTMLEEQTYKTMMQVVNQIQAEVQVPVYIQTHALHRMAERMDTQNTLYRNLSFMASFLSPSVITSTNGQRLICAFDYYTKKCIGYFPFIKQNGAVFLPSFLPLSSPITPEGAILYKELDMQLEDCKYLGMDKFSFYIKTDFEGVPKVKSALKKAGMWHLTKIEPAEKAERKEDLLLKQLFATANEQ